MAEDVWTALVKGTLAFTHTQAASLVGDAFDDTGALVTSLFDSSPPGTPKARLQTLKTDVSALADAAKPVINAVEPEAGKAKAAVTQMAAELGTDPFTMEAAGRATVELAKVLRALDAAIDIIAVEIAKPSPDEAVRASITKDIKGIKEPWIRPFRSLAADSTELFDKVCKEVLGIDNAGKELQDALKWDDVDKRLSMELVSLGPRSVGPASSAIGLDGASIEAFFAFKTDAILGITLKTKLKAGLRSDKMLEKIIPGQPPTADSNDTAITLDTINGLTFGNKDKKVILPVRFSFPGVELREMALALPVADDEKRKGKFDITLTVAAKFGDVVALVAEGAGVTVTIEKDGASVLQVAPRLPDGVGMRVNTGVVKGGGYLRRKESEFGGVIDLQFLKIGVTAIGLLGTDPFSMVIVIGVRFLPKIELGFGFTLSGLGGILAIDRRIDIPALQSGVREGTVDTLLFPDDPVAIAPKILDKLAAVFPASPGAFVVGPIAQLGWGSQAGFVKAKLGLVLALPDPKVLLLGAVEVAVPSTEVPEKIKIVQLRGEMLGVFTPDYFSLRFAINGSKIAGVAISGEMGVYVRWAGEAAFALSVGGFFPKYKSPAELGDLNRITADFSPGGVKWLSLHAEAYFALTANTVQFGAKIALSAKLGPVSARAWLSLDALFQWSPRFYFIVILDAGIEVKAFGATLLGVSFHGELQGTTPWRIEGHAKVEVLFWDVDVDIGPHEWGERDVSTGVELSPIALTKEALSADEAWTALLPPSTETLARFIPDDTTPLLMHPLSALQVRQQRVPLETNIDRIGAASVSANYVYLSDPMVGGEYASAVTQAYDPFPPGHFLTLTQDEQAARPDFERFPSGMEVTASATPDYGRDGAPVGVPYDWETVYPHEPVQHAATALSFRNLSTHAFRTNAVSKAMRQRVNPYLPLGNAEARAGALELRDFGEVELRRSEDYTTPASVSGTRTTTDAARQLKTAPLAGEADMDDSLVLVAAGLGT